MNASLDPKSQRDNGFSESIISRSPEQAIQAGIELFAMEFVKKDYKMQKLILHDLHLAQHGTAEQVAQARDRLVKAGVPKSWSVEVLSVLESRIKDASLQVKETDYRDPKYSAFHNLFRKNDKIN